VTKAFYRTDIKEKYRPFEGYTRICHSSSVFILIQSHNMGSWLVKGAVVMHFNLKDSTEQMNAMKDRVARRVRARLNRAETEGKKVLNQLGAELDSKDPALSAVVARIRARNPNLKTFAKNLDVATYDLRGRLTWDLAMMSAYAKMKAEQAYAKDIKPRLSQVIAQLEDKLKTLKEKSKLQ
jgi:hypothetical protein